MAHSDSQYERPDQLSDQAPRGVIYLIGIQLFSRVVTFSANQILILHVCPQALGMSMQLELFANTVLYFARESIRAAAQAAPPSADGRNQSKPFDEQGVKEGVPNGRVRTPSAQAVVNMSYFASLLGLTLLLVFRFLYVRFFLRELLHAPYFSASFAVATVATGLEILAEPCFAAVQHDMLYRSRAIVETFSALSRGIFSCGIALWMSRQAIDPGPLPFAVGQIVSSLVVFWGYLVVARRAARENGYSLLPVPLLEQ